MPPVTTSSQALQQLQQYQNGAQTPDQAFTAANQQFGVPAAQQALTGLRGAIQQSTNLLGNVAPSVMGRTGNSLVTDAQANRIIGNEQQPIQQNLSKLGTDYGNAQQDFQNAETQANQKAQGVLTGQQGQLSYLQNLYNSLLGSEQQQTQNSQDAAKLAEQQREFNATPHGSSGGSAAAQPSLFQAISQGFQGYQPVNQGGKAYYTERTLLPALYSEYNANTPEAQNAIKQQVYNFRKQNFGE